MILPIINHIFIIIKIKYFNKISFYFKNPNLFNNWGLGIGDWGLGIGDWGLGPIPNPQSPIPKPQSPIPL